MIIPLHNDDELFALDRRRQDMHDRVISVESDDLRNEIMGLLCEIDQQIAERPVHTLAGIKVKLECVVKSLDYDGAHYIPASLRTAMKGLDGLAARERLTAN